MPGTKRRLRLRRALGLLVFGTMLALPIRSVPAAESIAFRVVAEYPHDPGAFTQGLVYHRGVLYESTGRRGQSDVRMVELETGRVIARRRLSDRLFGEGLARVGDRLYQLTWTSGIGFVYASGDLSPLNSFRYTGQGWGLAYDGRVLWKSDGSSRLEQRAPFAFRALGELEVTLDGAPLRDLNELEFVEGALYANVWRTDRIVRIDPTSGEVTGWLDLQQLLTPDERRSADVLNGIAWDSANRRLLVTGKLWPKLFALEIEDAK